MMIVDSLIFCRQAEIPPRLDRRRSPGSILDLGVLLHAVVPDGRPTELLAPQPHPDRPGPVRVRHYQHRVRNCRGTRFWGLLQGEQDFFFYDFFFAPWVAELVFLV